MSLITFNISIIVAFALIHIIIKPIYKKGYPLKFLGSVLIGILTVSIYDLIQLTCYLIIKINDYIK